jgi:hypothetical protein
MAGLDRSDFVLADLPEKNFLLTGIRIKSPHAILRYKRYREWPVFCPDIKDRIAIGLRIQPVHFLVFLDELLTVEPVLDRVARTDKVLPCPEYFRQGLLIVMFDGQEEGTAPRLGRRESGLTR